MSRCPLHAVLLLLGSLVVLPAAEPLARATGTPESRTCAAGSKDDFTVRFVLQQRLPVDSEIRVLTPREGGWSRPSLDPAKEPETPGAFVKVEWSLTKAAAGATLSGVAEKWSDRGPPYTPQDRVSAFVMKLAGAALEPSDSGEVRFPRSNVSRAALHLDPQANATGYRLQVRPAGETEWQEIEGLPRYAIVPAEPAAVRLRGRSTAVVGEPQHFALSILDRFGNPVRAFVGAVTLTSSDAAAEYPRTIQLGAAEHGQTTVEPVVFRTPGRQTLTAHGGSGLEGTPTDEAALDVTAAAPPLRLFWGELHSHGMFSYDARNWGGCTMRPADMLRWGRTVTGLDFCAVTDHSMHNNRLTQQNMTEAEFKEIQQAAATVNEPGRYVTFTACEQRCARGDTNLYFLGDADPFYMKDKPITIEEVWKLFRPGDLISAPHQHPGVKRAERFDVIDPAHEKLAEIHSNHGRYEYHENTPLFPKKGMVPGNNVQALLSRGHRLGIIAASDDHSGRPGSFDLTAVFAPELTREALFRALQARHCYGTTGSRINLTFRMGEQMMGDEVRVAPGDPLFATRRFSATVVGVQRLRNVEVVRNGKVVYSMSPEARSAAFDFADTTPLDQCWLGTEKGNPPTAYYYLRVTQQPVGAQGEQSLHMAWSSPIFLSPKA